MPHRFEDAAAWEAKFEDPARDAWQRPDEVVGFMINRPDLRVVDIGSATGYFPVRFARAAPQGHVVGVDIEQSMVDHLTARAAREGLTNLESRVVAPDDPGVAGMSPGPDLVFVCNTYHHIGDRVTYFQRLGEALDATAGARLAIVDFRVDSERGPPKKHKLAPDTVIGELAQAVRKGAPDEQLHELGDVLAWLASLANQLDLSLDEAMERYVTDPP